MEDEASRYSAGWSALGYLGQIDYALLFLLRRWENEEPLQVSLETIDDIVFGSATTQKPLEQWQSKYRISRYGQLSDMSVDLWKTLHNWIQESANSDTRLVLLTTDEATRGAAVEALLDGPTRSIERASEMLESAARKSRNKAAAPYFAAFLDMAPIARRSFLRRVYIVDKGPREEQIEKELLRELRRACPPPGRRESLARRLRGWWYLRCVKHLERVAKGLEDSISLDEVERTAYAINSTLGGDELPLDVTDIVCPSEAEVTEDNRLFLRQLRVIRLHSSRLTLCVRDHNRASAQRLIWVRESLLPDDELNRYDRKLYEQWQAHFLPIGEDDAPPDVEPAQSEWGRRLFMKLSEASLPAIRPAFQEPFMGRGSMHILADNAVLGWHPRWEDQCTER
jgi:hypothetical protein